MTNLTTPAFRRVRGGRLVERDPEQIRREFLYKETVLLLAGPVAEDVFLRLRPDHVSSDKTRISGYRKDLEDVDRIVHQLALTESEAAAWGGRATSTALRIVVSRWEAVERVASALMRANTLSAEELRRLLRKPRSRAARPK